MDDSVLITVSLSHIIKGKPRLVLRGLRDLSSSAQGCMGMALFKSHQYLNPSHIKFNYLSCLTLLIIREMQIKAIIKQK